MIDNVLTKDTVMVNVEVDTWEQAIQIAGDLLYKNDYIEKRYIDSMIKVVKDIGPYIVLIKGVALAHARPEEGAKKTGLSLITLKEPIYFGNEENDPVSLVFALSALDNFSHIDLISEMALIFEDEEGMRKMQLCSTKEELLEIVHKITTKPSVL